MAEIPSLYAQRAIVHRQMRGAMYHPFIEAAALTLVDIPITFRYHCGIYSNHLLLRGSAAKPSINTCESF